MILVGNAFDHLKLLPSNSVHCCVTSPPYYGLKDYGMEGQIGLEQTPEQFVTKLKALFREVRRVLRPDGTLWLNLGDSYWRGPQKHLYLKDKDLIGIPWKVAFALQQDGWYLRSDLVWSKPNPMPESVKDRPTRAHEFIFLFSKSETYYYDHEAIKEPVKEASLKRQSQAWKGDTDRSFTGARHNNMDRWFGGGGATHTHRNKRSVWEVTTGSSKNGHHATYPTRLVEPCILAGCPKGGTVLDPFLGSGTTALVAAKLERQWIGIELNPEYAEIAIKRTGWSGPARAPRFVRKHPSTRRAVLQSQDGSAAELSTGE